MIGYSRTLSTAPSRVGSNNIGYIVDIHRSTPVLWGNLQGFVYCVICVKFSLPLIKDVTTECQGHMRNVLRCKYVWVTSLQIRVGLSTGKSLALYSCKGIGPLLVLTYRSPGELDWKERIQPIHLPSYRTNISYHSVPSLVKWYV